MKKPNWIVEQESILQRSVTKGAERFHWNNNNLQEDIYEIGKIGFSKVELEREAKKLIMKDKDTSVFVKSNKKQEKVKNKLRKLAMENKEIKTGNVSIEKLEHGTVHLLIIEDRKIWLSYQNLENLKKVIEKLK